MSIDFVPLLAPITVVLFAYRVRQTKRELSIFPALAPGEVRFEDTKAYGRSLQSLSTKLSGAQTMMNVVVTRDELWIRISWPFRLVFSGVDWDLMHKIPLNRLTSVKAQEGWEGRRVEIQFADDSNEVHTLVFRLRRHEEFLALVPPRCNPGPESLLRPAGNAIEDASLLIPVTSSETPSATALLRPAGTEEHNSYELNSVEDTPVYVEQKQKTH